jgi:small subunit ribosomal protein S17
MKKTKVGRVVSDRMEKTIVVQVEERKFLRRYRKHIRRHFKFYVHDPQETANMGDLVKIEEARPLSRLKRWRLVEVIKRAEA